VAKLMTFPFHRSAFGTWCEGKIPGLTLVVATSLGPSLSRS
jgi:hypothetical protein